MKKEKEKEQSTKENFRILHITHLMCKQKITELPKKNPNLRWVPPLSTERKKRRSCHLAWGTVTITLHLEPVPWHQFSTVRSTRDGRWIVLMDIIVPGMVCKELMGENIPDQ